MAKAFVVDKKSLNKLQWIADNVEKSNEKWRYKDYKIVVSVNEKCFDVVKEWEISSCFP